VTHHERSISCLLEHVERLGVSTREAEDTAEAIERLDMAERIAILSLAGDAARERDGSLVVRGHLGGEGLGQPRVGLVVARDVSPVPELEPLRARG
jgi:hypothetical protein